MSDRIETIILRNLLYNDDYTRRILPYLSSEYFRQNHEKAIYEGIDAYVNKYNSSPTREALEISLQDNKGMVESTYNAIVETLGSIETEKDTKVDQEWLVDQTEEFCKEKALYNAARKTVAIMEGVDKKLDKGAIPGLFEDALAISFDPSVGHDYLENAAERYDKLHSVESKIPFAVDILNKVTKGGITEGTLNLLAGGVYAGKTLGLCYLAGEYVRAGIDTLYITLEISEENIGFRIDSNLLNISTDEADSIPKDVFLKRVKKIKDDPKTGKLVIKEYPAHSVHVNNFRALIHELYLKRKFKPKVILVDYLGLCSSARIKPTDKTYVTIQAVAEEMRSLAQELGVPIWSATQLDAEGMNSSDPGITNISGSKVGLSATCDLLWMLVVSDKLRELGQMMITQHKNRYKDAADQKKFYIGVDRKKMRWHNVEQKGQIQPDGDEDILGPNTTDEDEEIKRRVSKKYGSEAYKSAYAATRQARELGSLAGSGDGKKSKFAGFKM